MTTTALIENVEWMLAHGEHPEQIARRVHMDRRSLLTRLNRAGRRDLAEQLWRAPA